MLSQIIQEYAFGIAIAGLLGLAMGAFFAWAWYLGWVYVRSLFGRA
jgi:uncharacterized membrane protein